MPGFDSPNFKKNIPQQTSGLRQFTVAAPEDEVEVQHNTNEIIGQQPVQKQLSPSELEAQLKERRRQKMEAQNKIGDAAKKRIELLADIGRMTKDVNIGGFIFSLRTLKSKETREAASATFSSALTQVEASFESRKQQLARSLFKIDGEDVGLVIGGNTLEDKIKFIENDLEETVVARLWEEFASLKEESSQKYGINSEKDIKEVQEDLKK